MESHEEKLRRLFYTEGFRRLSGVAHRALMTEGFLEGLLIQDTADDWQVVLDAGQYLALTGPDLIVGDVIIARANRHLGNRSEAIAAIRTCRELLRRLAPSEMELHVLLPIIEAEEKALADDTPGK